MGVFVFWKQKQHHLWQNFTDDISKTARWILMGQRYSYLSFITTTYLK